jgi:hypothetical protein
MTVTVADLPRIAEILHVDATPYFLVFPYTPYVRFVVAASPWSAPNVVALLDVAGEHAFVVVRCEDFRSYLGQLDISGSVDEAHYLAKHADVRLAVERGQLRSGTQHYLISGYFERRVALLPHKAAG